MKLQGAITAMVTPFCGERVDEEGFIRNIELQLEAQIAGLVFLGTTGEGMVLAEEEERRVIEIGVRRAKGKALVLVGTGSNSTSQAIAKTKKARELGADLAIIAAPYYNKPTQEGLFRHYEAIATSVDLPIVVYNVPSRTGVNIETPTLLRLAELRNIVGAKEASGNVAQIADMLQMIGSRHPTFSILSGDDALTLPLMALGATGVISIVSNLVPKPMVRLVSAALEGRFQEARQVHETLLPLFRASFFEVNPIPIKQAMNFCGLAAGSCRLPLCEMRQENREKLVEVLTSMGLISP